MRMNPRAVLCNTAQINLQRRILDWFEEYDLTTIEQLAILNHTLSGMIGGTLRQCIRSERHEDDPESKANEQAQPENGKHHRDD